ncbi:unnamed protein product [Lactuca virosa]|uniref:NAC domain-containing protein n=1 Tax=Lactuca virosa TaxID=75947 RepID=A0AAU9NIQ2_9ASTR|nr:unnamed protein product [Lactuca virosa]
MAKSWLVDGRSIARKVKTSGLPLVHQIKDCGANRECPQCHYKIDNSNVSVEWPGFPLGVKFEPTDVELLEHLAAKCGLGNKKPHQFIDEFIPTIDVDEGICCKHPENLPGATKDGNSVHFFYRNTNAYTTGQRKRRKISKESGLTNDVRWHKTGKTKAVIQNGVQIGCKKIMVLYGTAGGGSKPYKLNWVMHQYHLGTVEDEKEGEYVVSKIFYQPQKQENHEDSDAWMSLTSPRTPNTGAPDPPRAGKSVACDDVTTGYVLESPPQPPLPPQESELCDEQKYLPSCSNAEGKENLELPIWEDDSQAVDLDDLDDFGDSLFCKENLDIHALQSCSNVDTNVGASSGVGDLENLDLGTPPDFNLADLQFSSQDSIFGWLERL